MSTRYLYGQTRPMKVPVATAQAVEVGDLTAIVANTLVRAQDIAWNTTLLQTQTDFASAFLGVSGQRKVATVARVPGNGEDNVIRVDPDGVFEFDCASASFDVGDYLGPADSGSSTLMTQKVVEVATEAAAFARVVEKGTSVTRVKAQLLSKLGNASRFA